MSLTYTKQDLNLRPEGLVPKTSALDHSAIRARGAMRTGPPLSGM
jgi:hypothetical protein